MLKKKNITVASVVSIIIEPNFLLKPLTIPDQ